MEMRDRAEGSKPSCAAPAISPATENAGGGNAPAAPAAPAMPKPSSSPPVSVNWDAGRSSPRFAHIVGTNLRHLRKKMFPGWGGQRKFAEFLSLSPNDICVYEHGRIVPNELRLANMAQRLGLTVEQLRTPLPGVEVPVRPPAAHASEETAEEKRWRDQAEAGERQIARLEGRIEALQEQQQQLSARAAQLQEANYVLRYLLYGDDTPSAKARRERILDNLEPAIAEMVRSPEVF